MYPGRIGGRWMSCPALNRWFTRIRITLRAHRAWARRCELQGTQPGFRSVGMEVDRHWCHTR